MQQPISGSHSSVLHYSSLQIRLKRCCGPCALPAVLTRCGRRALAVAQASSGREQGSRLVCEAGSRSTGDQIKPLLRHLQAPTAAHAYSAAVSLTQQAQGRTSDSSSTVTAPQVPNPTKGQAATKQADAGASQQQQQHQAWHHQTAYTFVAPNWEPLVGRSRQHTRVEKEVLRASRSRNPLVVSGDVGLNTLRIAATVHALGLDNEDVSHPMVVVDCSSALGVDVASQLLQGGLDGLLHGTDYAKSSVDVANDGLLLSALTEGTLVLNNVHKAPYRLLRLADAAIGAIMPLKAAKKAVAPSKDEPAAAAAGEQPGSFLKAHRTRLVLVSQLPLTQLTQQLTNHPAAAAAAAAVDVGLAFKDCPSIALPALRARASDIGPLAVAAGHATAALRGYQSVELTDAAEKQLTSYDFPGNEAELKGLLQRAIMLHPPAPTAASSGCSSSDGGCGSDGSSVDGCCSGCGSSEAEGPVLVLDVGDFWAATGVADRARVDVLEVLPWLRKYVLDTGLWPIGLNRITQFLYPLVLVSLFLGPQDRDSSAALTVFWAGWWPLVTLSFPFMGRAWCAMCPFMITGEAAQDMVPDSSSSSSSSSAAAAPTAAAATGAQAKAAAGLQGLATAVASAAGRKAQKLSGAAAGLVPQEWQLQKWPTEAIEPWAGWFVIAAFAGILMWEQVWDLPGHANLSGWLLVLITSGAVACSIVFEKRLWCRYLCPIGAMNGLFSKLAMTEIRNRPGLCAAAACNKPCHNGRIEHETLQVPCANPTSCTSSGFGAVPSLISTLLPWTSSSGGSCGSGCSSDSIGCGTADCSSYAPALIPREVNGQCPLALGDLNSQGMPSTFSCSAFIDASALHEKGRQATPLPSVPNTGTLLTAEAAGAGSAGTGVVTIERDVVLPGCPMNSYPGKNKDNHLCIMCGNCLRACTGGSAQWRLRPPAADLWGDHEASWTELHLMNVLLGSVLLHKLPEVCAQLGLPAEEVMSEKGLHLTLCAALLAAPSAVTWLFHRAASAAMDGMAERTAAACKGPAALLAATGEAGYLDAAQQQEAGGVSALRMSYSVLPLVWAGILAHYEDLLLTELGLLAPRFALSLGISQDSSWLPALPTLGPAPAAVVAAAQGVTLFIGAALSLALAGKIAAVEVQHGRARHEEVEKSVLPQRLLTVLMAAELWHLIL